MDKITQIKTMLSQHPNDEMLSHALALEYLKIENFGEAKHILSELLNHNPNYVGSYYHLANTFIKLNDIENAISALEKGMHIAKEQNNKHAYSEMQMLLDDIM